MPVRLIIVFLFSLNLLTVNLSAASEGWDKNGCSLYLRVDEKLQCSSKKIEGSDYLTEFGYKFCRHFTKSAENWDAALQLFISTVATCLQNDVVESMNQGLSCPQLEAKAFNNHPACYRFSGFCELSLLQKAQLFSAAARFDLLFKPDQSVLQTLRIVTGCRLTLYEW